MYKWLNDNYMNFVDFETNTIDRDAFKDHAAGVFCPVDNFGLINGWVVLEIDQKVNEFVDNLIDTGFLNQ